MKITEFVYSLDQGACPASLEPRLKALWYDARGDWHRAHQIVQQINDPLAARIHAYLHRKEGDEWNARYWHRRAGSSFPQHLSLKQEWTLLVNELADQ